MTPAPGLQEAVLSLGIFSFLTTNVDTNIIGGRVFTVLSISSTKYFV